MKEAHLIVVGKLKDKHLEAIEKNYLDRLKSNPLLIHEVKAFSEDTEQGALAILKKIKEIAPTGGHLVALAEKGQTFTSVSFSKWLFQHLEYNNLKLIFIIAGACGHHKTVLELAQEKLSLSPLTFPHKIARILLVEQFYRAVTIKNQHPYHN